jgi:hypothetical protein
LQAETRLATDIAQTIDTRAAQCLQRACQEGLSCDFRLGFVAAETATSTADKYGTERGQPRPRGSS